MDPPLAAQTILPLKTRRLRCASELRPAANRAAFQQGLPHDNKAPLVHQLTRRITRLQRRLQHAHVDSIMALVGAVEAKDPYTRHHSLNVSIYAEALAGALGLSDKDREIIKIAAMLHDVGKIGLPDTILTKPGPLTDVEFSMMKEHPAIGAAILKPVSFLNRVRPLVLHHHEWFDGNGYPAGLQANQIPLGARILHVADAVDAMASPRTYKAAYSLDETLDQLRKGRGGQFDPQIADAAMDWLKAHQYAPCKEATGILRRLARRSMTP